MSTNDESLRLVEPELSGGKISKEKIASEIENSDATELTISGLRQDTFEFLLENYVDKFHVINFWKCPRVEDLSPFELAGNLQKITWFWNQKCTSLWDFSKTRALVVLHIKDFQKVRSIEEISKSRSLETLELEGGMWKNAKIDSFAPLIELSTLKTLSFSVSPADQKVRPFTQIKGLRELQFSPKIFKTEQIAWLKSKIGDEVESDVLTSHWKENDFTGKDTLIIGKRKPFLDSRTQKEKIIKYIKQFDDLVEYYKRHPDVEEPI